MSFAGRRLYMFATIGHSVTHSQADVVPFLCFPLLMSCSRSVIIPLARGPGMCEGAANDSSALIETANALFLGAKG